MTAPQDVLEFWFGPRNAPGYPADNSQMWWKKHADVDAACRERFGPALDASARGELVDWAATRDGRQAHIILVDQLARNMHRDRPGMFAQDELALELSLYAISLGDPWGRPYRELQFFLMPLMHAENRVIQRLSVRLFQHARDIAAPDCRGAAEKGVDYAVRHAEIVERFGRFPHRNAILGRESSAEEIEFLEQPGSSF